MVRCSELLDYTPFLANLFEKEGGELSSSVRGVPHLLNISSVRMEAIFGVFRLSYGEQFIPLATVVNDH